MDSMGSAPEIGHFQLRRLGFHLRPNISDCPSYGAGRGCYKGRNARADIHFSLLHFRPHFPMIPYFPILSRSSRGSRARQSARGAGGLARGRPAVPRAHEAYHPPSPARLSTFCQGHPRGWRYRPLKREDSGAQAM